MIVEVFRLPGFLYEGTPRGILQDNTDEYSDLYIFSGTTVIFEPGISMEMVSPGFRTLSGTVHRHFTNHETGDTRDVSVKVSAMELYHRAVVFTQKSVMVSDDLRELLVTATNLYGREAEK